MEITNKCVFCGLELINPLYPHKSYRGIKVCHNCLQILNESELIN